MAYYPPPSSSPDGWARCSGGFDAARLAEAVAYAESPAAEFTGYGPGEDVEAYLFAGGMVGKAEGEFAAIVGPTKARRGVNGLIVHRGRIAAEWGDTARPDMTFSVTKSYLSTVASFAWAGGAMRASATGAAGDERGLDESVSASERRRHGGLGAEAYPANARITWRQLLQQTSEWRGTLWGKPEQVDHNRRVGGGATMAADANRKGEAREYREPGAYWEVRRRRDVGPRRRRCGALSSRRRLRLRAGGGEGGESLRSTGCVSAGVN